MDSKKLVKNLISLIFSIFILNFLANKFYWYSSVWFFDMPMHFLGGLWVGLFVFYALSKSKITSFNPTNPYVSILMILFFVLVVGIGWEVFEVLVNNVVARNPFNVLDTASDLFFDLAGGAYAILYFIKRIMSTGQNPV